AGQEHCHVGSECFALLLHRPVLLIEPRVVLSSSYPRERMVLSELAMRAYNASPRPCRSAMASTRGFYLRLWRYGHDTERLVEEALERETWSEARWRSWQQERLAFVLNRAATRVPFYRGHWSERRCKGDRASWEYLENWPVLEKENVRRHPRAFVAEDCSPRRMFSEHTSGTTGKPLQ